MLVLRKEVRLPFLMAAFHQYLISNQLLLDPMFREGYKSEG
jgi:hypothetical protein